MGCAKNISPSVPIYLKASPLPPAPSLDAGWLATLLYSTLLHSTLLYSTLLYSTLLDPTLLYSSLPYSTILYFALLGFAWLCFVLRCLALQSSAQLSPARLRGTGSLARILEEPVPQGCVGCKHNVLRCSSRMHP